MHDGYCAWKTIFGMLPATEACECTPSISMEMHQARYFLAVARTALRVAEIRELNLSRTVHLYGVAGRQRTAVAAAILRLLRGADWSQYSH
jgi:hypothetical protein